MVLTIRIRVREEKFAEQFNYILIVRIFHDRVSFITFLHQMTTRQTIWNFIIAEGQCLIIYAKIHSWDRLIILNLESHTHRS